MVDKVEVTNKIQLDERQSDSWAQEDTLTRLLLATSNTNKILSTMAKSKGLSLDGVRELDQAVGRVAPSVRGLGPAAEEGARGILTYKEALNNLRYNTTRLGSTMDGIIRGTADPMRALPGALSGAGNAVAAFANRMGVRGRLITGGLQALGISAGAAAARFMDSAEAYRSMISTGILFDGSITGMISSVRSSGVSLQQASQIIQNRSQALIIGGETQFFRTVGSMGETFARFGMTMDQGAETMAELMDQQRITGSLFSMSQQDIIAANTKQLNQMQAISRLTGVSIRQQTEERRRIGERMSMRVMASQLEGPQLAQFEALKNALASTGLGEDAAAGILLQQFGRGPTRAGAIGEQAVGPEGMRVIMEAMRSGDSSLIQQNAQIFAENTRRFLGRLEAGAVERGGTAAEYAGIAMPAFERARLAAEGPTAAARQEQAARAARGESLLTPGTLGYYKTVNNTAIAMGTLESVIMKQLAPGMEYLWEQAGRASSALTDLFVTLEQRGAAAALWQAGQMVATTVAENPLESGLAALGLGGGVLAMRRMMTPTSAAPGAGGGGGAAGPGGMARLRAGVGKLLGIEQLVSAGQSLYEGNYLQAAGHAGLFLGGRNPFVMGARAVDTGLEMITGRGLVERTAGMFGQSGQTAPLIPTGAQTPEELGSAAINRFRESITRMDTAMASVASYLAPGGHIETRLIEITNAVNSQGANTATLLRNL
jgi:hypothetical protein